MKHMFSELKSKLSIYSKLRLIIMRVLVIAFLLLFTLLAAQNIYKAFQHEREHIHIVSELVATNVTSALLYHDSVTTQQVLDTARASSPSITHITLQDKGNGTFTSFDKTKKANSDKAFWQQIQFSHPVVFNGSEIGELTIIVSLYSMWLSIVTNLVIVALILLAALFLAFFLVPNFASSIIDPIKKLAETARIITKTEKYGLRTEKYSDDEVGELTDTVNEMLDLIEARDGELRIAATAFNTQEAIIITDSGKNIIRVNLAYTEITGYELADVKGKTPLSFTSNPQNKEQLKQIDNEILDKGFWSGELIGVHKNKTYYPADYMITVVKNIGNEITNYVLTFSDISERVASEEKIRHLAFYDSLTQLPNRRLLIERLKVALKTSERHDYFGALFFLDLDKFKILNDSKGHHYGDMLLTEVANRLSDIVRAVDTVARLGGDEFIVMLEHLDQDERLAMAEANTVGNKIVSTLNQPYLLDAFTYNTSASVGVTLFHSNDNEIATLLSQADTAMYAAKNSGRNTLQFFGADLQEAIEKRISEEQALRVALDKQQFELYYQIQVDNEGQAEGAEALIRWHHPIRGLVPPSEFIPLAEEVHLIEDIGLWVIDTACQKMEQWEQADTTKHLVLSINISALHFQKDDFVNKFLHIVKEYKINPQKLNIELTETVVLENVDVAILKMKQIKAAGITISMDDFGTGYSSLNYVSRLPVDQIKIDRSFVSRSLDSEHDKLIIQMVIALGHMLKIGVIAEGVEVESQFNLLQEMGCDSYQGHYFGSPMPILELELVLQNNYLSHIEIEGINFNDPATQDLKS
ncbi:MAG: EAL domain-containing protein [Methylophaga sp.]|nr:EAL domain-containing protein [Methylophaga sp.]